MRCTICGKVQGGTTGVCDPCRETISEDKKRAFDFFCKENPVPKKKEKHYDKLFKRGKSRAAKKRRERADQKANMTNRYRKSAIS